MATILITGATGRLGRALIARLADQDIEASAIVMPGDPMADAIVAQGVREVHRIDLASASVGDLAVAVRSASVIVHAASLLPGTGVTDHALFSSIVPPTFALLEAARISCNEPRFVYISSSAVYGPQLPPDHEPIREEHSIRPTSAYGAAKAAAEILVGAARRIHALPTTILRLSDIVTRSDLVTTHGYIGARLRVAPDSGSIALPVGDDGQASTLSMAPASEIARAVAAVVTHDTGVALGRAYNLAGVDSPDDREVAEMIADHEGWRLEPTVVAAPRRRWILDARRFAADLGVELQADLSSTLEKG